MKKFLFVCVLMLGCLICFSCKNKKTNQIDTHQVFFVRHAEKADDGTRDPALTTEGNQRAMNLSELLEKEGITKIYSTDYKRTRSTGQPLADKLNLEIIIYNPSDEEFAKALIEDIKSGSTLVVGHSNTTPKLVNAVLGEEKYEELSEDDYGNLFIVKGEVGGLEAELKRY